MERAALTSVMELRFGLDTDKLPRLDKEESMSTSTWPTLPLELQWMCFNSWRIQVVLVTLEK
jgi:hypothetical protein